MTQLWIALGHVVLGTIAAYIIYIAYTSYRKYDDPVLGMICLGFVFIGAGATGQIVLESVLGVPNQTAEGVEVLLNIIGFGWIVLALRG